MYIYMYHSSFIFKCLSACTPTCTAHVHVHVCSVVDIIQHTCRYYRKLRACYCTLYSYHIQYCTVHVPGDHQWQSAVWVTGITFSRYPVPAAQLLGDCKHLITCWAWLPVNHAGYMYPALDTCIDPARGLRSNFS